MIFVVKFSDKQNQSARANFGFMNMMHQQVLMEY